MQRKCRTKTIKKPLKNNKAAFDLSEYLFMNQVTYRPDVIRNLPIAIKGTAEFPITRKCIEYGNWRKSNASAEISKCRHKGTVDSPNKVLPKAVYSLIIKQK